MDDQNAEANSLEALQDMLRSATDKLRAGITSDDPVSQRESALEALSAAIDFIDSLQTSPEGLSSPLRRLKVALWQCKEGKEDPLFKPSPTETRPADTTAEMHTKAYAALAMDILMKNGMKKGEASRSVAKEMEKSGYKLPGRTPLSGQTVKGWRDKCTGRNSTGRNGRKPISMAIVYNSMRRELETRDALDRETALQLARTAGSGHGIYWMPPKIAN